MRKLFCSLLFVLLFLPLVSAYGVTFFNPAWNPQDGKVFETVEANKQYVFDIKEESIAITKVTFEINRTVSNGGITVYYLKTIPKAVPYVEENDSYQFNEIKYAGFVPFDTKYLLYDFRVSKGWLQNTSTPRDTVALHALDRFSETWETLPTKITGDDADFVYYSAAGKGVHYLFIGKSQSGATASSLKTGEEPVEVKDTSDAEEIMQETKSSEVVPVELGNKQEPVVQQTVATPVAPSAKELSESSFQGNVKLYGVFILVLVAVIVVFIYLIFSNRKGIYSVDKELHGYIAESLKRGRTKEEVRNRLLEVGWHHERVDKALSKHK